MIIEIDGLRIEVLKKPVKNMNLRIYPPDGTVRVSAPLRYSNQLIKQTLQEKSAWIIQQQERIKKQSLSLKETSFDTGSQIPFKGKNYLLMLHEHNGPLHITMIEDIIHFYLPPNSSDTQKSALLDRWYKTQMTQIIPDLIQHWQSIIPVKVHQWGIKKMKTRWGSCNTRTHRIWLNLNLIQKPMECLEYVLVHELVHLMEASHNQRFYKLMTQFMPHWRKHQLALEGKGKRGAL